MKKLLICITTRGGAHSTYLDVPRAPVMFLDYTGKKRPGIKSEGGGQTMQYLHRLLKKDPPELLGMVSHDVFTRVSDVIYLADLTRRFGLAGGAISLTTDSLGSHPWMKNQPGRFARMVDWIEFQANVLRWEVFDALQPFYAHSISAWGIDGNAAPHVNRKLGLGGFAVFDCMTCYHSVFNSSTKTYRGRTPVEESAAVMEAVRRDQMGVL